MKNKKIRTPDIFLSKCDCGQELGYAKSKLMCDIGETRYCTNCGKTHFVNQAPTDWAMVAKGKIYTYREEL